MPYTIEVDRQCRRVLFKANGNYSQEESFQSIQDVLGHPDYQAGHDVLVDMTDVEDVPLWSADIFQKVEFDKALIAKLGTAKWAFVAPRDLVYGLARMYQTLMDDTPIEVEVFRELEPAQAWLNEGW